MEQLIMTLANFGGMGALAAVLLVLHRESIKAFRDEMKEERTTRWEEIREDRESSERRHLETMRILAAHHEQQMAEHRESRDSVRETVRQNVCRYREEQARRRQGPEPAGQ